MATHFNFLPLGANLHTFTLNGVPLVISLPEDEKAYTSTGNPAYFGETIGRVGNRIRDATINLNGTTYTLDRNERTNTLHGGSKGWGKQRWSGPFDEPAAGSSASWSEVKRVRFELHSQDGDGGFPAAVEARAWYTSRTSSDGTQAEVEVEYEVTFPKDSTATGKHGEKLDSTLVNVTNHTAFSIGPVKPDGESRSIAGTKVSLATALRQEVDETSLLPTGNITEHPLVTPGKGIDLGARQPAFDDCFVMPHAAEKPQVVPLDTRKGELRKLMAATNDESRVHFEAWSTEPAFQFYTGEYIDLDYEGQKYRPRAGFCVEASRFIDAASKPEWKGMVELRRGEVWGSKTVYRAHMKQ